MAEGVLPQIGPYTIADLLYTGSTYTLYRGKRGKKEVAIKRLDVELTTNEAREAFLERGRQIKKVKSRDIVETIDIKVDGNHGYLIQEYVVGTTWHERRAAGVQLAP